ncbi:YfiR family protein [Stieleria neptunia]|uniref:YfiR family protein n=1 Tax=Stieleria neptunia TaxID=2527979 RepID=UPI001E591829|nr:YfiR family protein [Stieleria neptunia]
MTLLVLTGLLTGPPAAAQTGMASERNVKVAYLYNFLRYVRWPPTAYADDSAPTVIGIMSGDPHGRLLNQVAATKSVRGRRIVVRQFDSVSEIQACHLVFLHAGTAPSDEAEAIARTAQQNALLICDAVVAPQRGVPIRFFADHDGTIGLKINVDAMARRGLQADAKLLNIATIERD